jgi:hypothetical protein
MATTNCSSLNYPGSISRPRLNRLRLRVVDTLFTSWINRSGKVPTYWQRDWIYALAEDLLLEWEAPSTGESTSELAFAVNYLARHLGLSISALTRILIDLSEFTHQHLPSIRIGLHYEPSSTSPRTRH